VGVQSVYEVDPYREAKCRSSHSSRNYGVLSLTCCELCRKMTYRVSQKWNGRSSLLWIWPPVCDVWSASIVLTHCSRLATSFKSAWVQASVADQTLCVLRRRSEMSCVDEHQTHLGILECLVSPGKGGFDRVRCRINLTYSLSRA
jgi:hypothetical protein